MRLVTSPEPRPEPEPQEPVYCELNCGKRFITAKHMDRHAKNTCTNIKPKKKVGRRPNCENTNTEMEGTDTTDAVVKTTDPTWHKKVRRKGWRGAGKRVLKKLNVFKK